MTGLTVLDALPEGFLDCSPRDLHRLFSGPTIIELPGRRQPPLFVSVLLHGNEDSGLEAVQRVLRARAGHTLARGLVLLIGNVAAAREGVRRLTGQPDYNRVWPGTLDHIGTPEAKAMAQAHELMLSRPVFAAIDLHNNTGLNPHYSVVCSLDARTLHLATLFTRTAVWFAGMPGTQTASLAASFLRSPPSAANRARLPMPRPRRVWSNRRWISAIFPTIRSAIRTWTCITPWPWSACARRSA